MDKDDKSDRGWPQSNNEDGEMNEASPKQQLQDNEAGAVADKKPDEAANPELQKSSAA